MYGRMYMYVCMYVHVCMYVCMHEHVRLLMSSRPYRDFSDRTPFPTQVWTGRFSRFRDFQ